METDPKCTFVTVNIAAQRARQLMQGAAPLIRTSSRKPAAVAIREVAEGLIPSYMLEDLPQLEEPADEEAVEAAPPDETT
ncbi:MAG: DNA-directed RNA polymerase subunit omega [Acidobacteriota bacterium]